MISTSNFSQFQFKKGLFLQSKTMNVLITNILAECSRSLITSSFWFLVAIYYSLRQYSCLLQCAVQTTTGYQSKLHDGKWTHQKKSRKAKIELDWHRISRFEVNWHGMGRCRTNSSRQRRLHGVDVWPNVSLTWAELRSKVSKVVSIIRSELNKVVLWRKCYWKSQSIKPQLQILLYYDEISLIHLAVPATKITCDQCFSRVEVSITEPGRIQRDSRVCSI